MTDLLVDLSCPGSPKATVAHENTEEETEIEQRQIKEEIDNDIERRRSEQRARGEKCISPELIQDELEKQANDVKLLDDEVFDFDIPLSPDASQTEKVETEAVKDEETDEVKVDEEEIFFGPMGYMEKCVAKNVEDEEKVLEVYKPMSPLSADQIAELFKEAHTVAFHISSTRPKKGSSSSDSDGHASPTVKALLKNDMPSANCGVKIVFSENCQDRSMSQTLDLDTITQKESKTKDGKIMLSPLEKLTLPKVTLPGDDKGVINFKGVGRNTPGNLKRQPSLRRGTGNTPGNLRGQPSPSLRGMAKNTTPSTFNRNAGIRQSMPVRGKAGAFNRQSGLRQSITKPITATKAPQEAATSGLKLPANTNTLRALISPTKRRRTGSSGSSESFDRMSIASDTSDASNLSMKSTGKRTLPAPKLRPSRSSTNLPGPGLSMAAPRGLHQRTASNTSHTSTASAGSDLSTQSDKTGLKIQYKKPSQIQTKSGGVIRKSLSPPLGSQRSGSMQRPSTNSKLQPISGDQARSRVNPAGSNQLKPQRSRSMQRPTSLTKLQVPSGDSTDNNRASLSGRTGSIAKAGVSPSVGQNRGKVCAGPGGKDAGFTRPGSGIRRSSSMRQPSTRTRPADNSSELKTAPAAEPAVCIGDRTTESNGQKQQPCIKGPLTKLGLMRPGSFARTSMKVSRSRSFNVGGPSAGPLKGTGGGPMKGTSGPMKGPGPMKALQNRASNAEGTKDKDTDRTNAKSTISEKPEQVPSEPAVRTATQNGSAIHATPVKKEKNVQPKRLVAAPEPKTPTKNSDNSSHPAATGTPSSTKRRSFLPTPKRGKNSTSSAGSMSFRGSVSSVDSLDSSMSSPALKNPAVKALLDLNGINDSSPSCLKSRKPKVQHTPMNKENQVEPKSSIWSPVRKLKPTADDEYYVCTKRTTLKY